MDPFTEKLLERTRARRENLQKKMADRPTGANRPMAKRSREPLADTNSIISEPAIEKVLPSSKPSPSKRRCSDENTLINGEENKKPGAQQSTALDPMTDKKPPVAPTSVRLLTAEQKDAHRNQEQELLPTHPPAESEKMVVCPPQSPARNTDSVMKHSAVDGARETQKDTGTPVTCGMRSRLQRLAEQRQYWESEGTSDTVLETVALSPLKSQKVDVPPPPASTHSEAPIGRKGRLANLAATIGSWENDLGHTPIRRDNTQAQPGTACVRPPDCTAPNTRTKPSTAAEQPQSAPKALQKSVGSSQQSAAYSPLKSTRLPPPSPQKTELPQPRLTQVVPTPVSSPLKPSSPLKSLTTTSSPHRGHILQSPLKNQVPSNKLLHGPNLSPSKPLLTTKPSAAVASTPLQQRGPAGTSGGVKSFLERFGGRCQERNQSSPSKLGGQSHMHVANPSATPKSRLESRLQERLGGAQETSSTAALTQKQKMEREAELAQVRNRFQKGKMGGSQEILTYVMNDTETKEIESSVQTTLGNKLSAPVPETLNSPSTSSANDMEHAIPSPVKKVEFTVETPAVKEEVKDDAEAVHEIEMNVDGSINSEVINDLFDGVLGEHEEDSDEDEEEDPLNISSMSLLAPLAETVAAVVKSPERKLMTSTPASSFCEKSSTPEAVSRPSKFQRTRMLGAGSSDRIDAIDEEQNLPYSIDAYRSTRVKTESERPHVKQVIVRKENVSHRIEAIGSPSHVNIKQKMKMLTNDMNLQQTVIHQASQALNCCTDEEHGKGSEVEAEAERLLLIATERRAAIKAELDRLKADGPAPQKKSACNALVDMGVAPSKGSISVLELRLPLKADFICTSANKPECGNHYFFVMIRAGAENTMATSLASTRNALSGDALTFTTKFTLSDVSNDFEIDIEVYYLVQKRELNTDKRKKPSKSKAITPKRFLPISKNNLQTPVMASPGGPNAVRTSSFVLVGSHKLTLASIGKNKFPLEKMRYEGSERELLSDMFHNKVPFLCPLEGNIYLKMHCEVGSRVEEKGFLTMFEDVSGFGSWHRRWCVLSGYCISYWTYPDDEKRKSPIGRINLANCTSRKVEPANREFCARPNTFELVTVRPQREDDRETLVSQCKDTMCVTKNWLSADTKDERNLWMQKLNQILMDLRMWQPDSCYRPM